MIYVLIVATCVLIWAVIWLGITCRDLLKDERKRNEGLCHKCKRCIRFDGVEVRCEKLRGLSAETCFSHEALTCKEYEENKENKQ